MYKINKNIEKKKEKGKAACFLKTFFLAISFKFTTFLRFFFISGFFVLFHYWMLCCLKWCLYGIINTYAEMNKENVILKYFPHCHKLTTCKVF